MGQYIARRFLLGIPVLVAVSVLIFGGVRLIPGNICGLVLGSAEAMTPDNCSRIDHDLGLDKPVLTQYFHWAGNAVQGDLGKSMKTHRPVLGDIRHRMSTTLELGLLASVFAIGIGLPMGVYSAFKQDKLPDVALRFVTIGWLSMPSFWVGTLLITLPAKWWGYAPPAGYVQVWDDPLQNLQQMYIPAIALGLALSATLARLTRSSMLEVLRQDYVRTARAKGLRESVVLSKHALKNAMLPVITLFGLQLGFLLGGTVVLESLFSLPGLGTLLLTSVLSKDYTQIQGLVLFFAFIIIVINIAVDLSYGLFDPRVRYS
ncbi:MAG TPA: ABC transporter permease [Dehalococcoidia bacterium]|nr:ABC transporter permease [Dehalococcoidia bacterium]